MRRARCRSPRAIRPSPIPLRAHVADELLHSECALQRVDAAGVVVVAAPNTPDRAAALICLARSRLHAHREFRVGLLRSSKRVRMPVHCGGLVPRGGIVSTRGGLRSAVPSALAAKPHRASVPSSPRVLRASPALGRCGRCMVRSGTSAQQVERRRQGRKAAVMGGVSCCKPGVSPPTAP